MRWFSQDNKHLPGQGEVLDKAASLSVKLVFRIDLYRPQQNYSRAGKVTAQVTHIEKVKIAIKVEQVIWINTVIGHIEFNEGTPHSKQVLWCF